MEVINIEQVLRYIQSQGGVVEFDTILNHFGATTKNHRHHLRSKLCRLVKQHYIIKTGLNSWVAV